MESFQELQLPEFLRQSLKQMNFVKPTPVQAQAIPPGLGGRDVIASAQTGTGKTAAFGIPLLTYLSANPGKTALVLTPTRELAEQVLAVLRNLSGPSSSWGSVLLIGGAGMGGQLNSLSRKPRLIIGTPGRIIDHLNRGSLNLGQTGFLVLDEADRMLDMGFAPQLDKIRERLTAPRQTLLFSATIPPDIQAMASKYLKDPVRVTVGETTQPVLKIAQMVVHTSEAKKPEELLNELKQREGSVLVFARTQHRVDRIAGRLKDQGIKVTRIHGGRTQSQRKQAIEHFREGHYRVLVATDIAARGLDIHHIAHVINYDLPRNPEDYIHRVGRTARAGAEGSSLCFVTVEDKALWSSILRLLGASKGAVQSKPSMFGDFTPKEAPPPQKHPRGGHSHQGHQPARRGSVSEGGNRHSQGPQPQTQPRPHRDHQPHPSGGRGKNHGGFHKKHDQEGQRHGRRDHFRQNRFIQGRDRNDRFIFHGKDDEHHRQQHQHQGEVDGNRTDFNQGRPQEKPKGFFKKFASKFSKGGGSNRNDRPFSRENRPAFNRDHRQGGEPYPRRFDGGRPQRFEDRQGHSRPFGERPRHQGPRPGGENQHLGFKKKRNFGRDRH
ncbi:MAG TPA: DEAD/DEAH box helicase [bacterium]|nr:DEAD/DEAH box helicase [bacterium]